MGGGNSYNNRAPSSFGSIDEKFNKINYKYLRNNEFEKNLYLGSILAQNQHKDKVSFF